jgi:tetratricopeptide (TPR) repeat protein
MKTQKLLALSLLIGASSFAQTLKDAIKKTDNERFDVAGADFRTLISTEPTKADNYFYAGDNYCKNDNIDSANVMWKKGSEVDPLSALNYVGLAKYLWFKGDTTAANIHIMKALSLTKNKNAEILRQVASIYIETPKFKKLDAAIILLEKAIKLDAKSAENYLLLGDALQEKTPENGSPAIKNYNLALGLDPKSPKAIVRTAKLYQRAKNYELANNKYKEAQALDPTYAPAYRENAELNMKFDQSSKAIENWKKYLNLNNSIDARYRYATSLFSGKRYCEAINELNTVQASGLTNFYIDRMLTYSYFECTENDVKANYVKGLESSDKFFSKVPSEKIIASDYRYKGLLLSKTGKDSLAIIELERAISSEPEKANELIGEVGKLQFKNKKYADAIVSYEKKRNGLYTNLSVQELNELGKAYYFGPKDYVLADTCFAGVAERSPSYAAAYLWRARSSFKIDPTNEKWLAKNHYVKYLELLTPEESIASNNKASILEAARYLGDCFVNAKDAKDIIKARVYWETIKKLEPTDKQAAAFFAAHPIK